MDWARDNACLSDQEAELKRIFKYDPQSSVVVKIARSNGYQMQIWSLATDDAWSQWLTSNTETEHSDSGLVVILAKRSGERPANGDLTTAMTYTDWLVQSEADNIPKVGVRRTQTFAALSEKKQNRNGISDVAPTKQQPGLRTLPFSYSTFQRICGKFRVHESITKAIARSDVPSFNCERVKMIEPAYVYNCNTSNSWPSNLALSATSYPGSCFTYGVFYGCTSTTEESILQRLHNMREESCHPLLLPGIFAELELIRHTHLVESRIVEVENKIVELDSQPDAIEGPERMELERRKEEKRTAWLELTYMRNSLITWNVQIQKMAQHAGEWVPDLNTFEGELKQPNEHDESDNAIRDFVSHKWDKLSSGVHESIMMGTFDSRMINKFNGPGGKTAMLQCLHDIGKRIKLRFETIQEEYNEKIRECSMRVDGMAMATQWSHSETAVEMALATNRESRVMKSISLVTMVFLPGTFFATVFSMTFFDWSGNEGNSLVSSYLWIYVVITVFFTAFTILLWYFFVIHRRANRKNGDEENLCQMKTLYHRLCTRMRINRVE